MAANLRDPGSIPGGDPKRFQDSSNYVFYIVGECFSSAADTHVALDLTFQKIQSYRRIQLWGVLTIQHFDHQARMILIKPYDHNMITMMI